MEEESAIPMGQRGRHPHHVAIYNREDVQQYGDNLPGDFQSQLPHQIHLIAECNDLTQLKHLWGSVEFDRAAFVEKFGDIATLMGVEIDFEAIRGMLQFWDPSYRCFVFNECDMVPTVEECAQMLDIKYSPETKVFKKSQKKALIGNMAKILGLKKKDMDGVWKEKNESIVITSRYLLDFIKQYPGHPSIGNVFALLIYGMVIFPKAVGHIDHWVVDVVQKEMVDVMST